MYKLYSQRLAEQCMSPSILQYDVIPSAFIQQYFFIAEDFFNHLPKPTYGGHRYWELLCKKYCLEKGIPLLGEDSEWFDQEMKKYLERIDTCVEDILDVIELTFSNEFVLGDNWLSLKDVFDMRIYHKTLNSIDIKLLQKQAIEKINERFRQHNLGYELVNGKIVRKDSEYLHAETVVPALTLITQNGFEGASHEFFYALQHRKQQHNEEAIDFALKALESTIKTICDRLKFPYDKQHDGASKLITILKNQNFLSSNSEISSWLSSTIQQELPTLRNKLGGHGDGEHHIPVPDAFADYALHLAATNIVFLVDLFKQKQANP